MTIPQSVFAFVILTLLKSIGLSVVEYPSFWVCLMFSDGQIEVLHFFTRIPLCYCDVVPSQNIMSREHKDICLINGDVELDHLDQQFLWVATPLGV